MTSHRNRDFPYVSKKSVFINKLPILTIFLMFTLVVHVIAPPPQQRNNGQKKFLQKIEAQGLYNANDHVTVLTRDTFHEAVYQQQHATLVEFYNAFCGFCRRFAPTYKEFAANVTNWQGIATVAAVDCATDDNNDLCRSFEVMAYPTIRYFPPNYANLPKQFGIESERHDNVEMLRGTLVEFLRNETAPAAAEWPLLRPLLETDSRAHLFGALPAAVDFIFLIYTPNTTTTATEVILDLHSLQRIRVHAIDSVSVANRFGLAGSGEDVLAVVNRQDELVQLSLVEFNRATVYSAISEFVAKRGLSAPVVMSTSEQSSRIEQVADVNVISDRDKEIVEHVRQEGMSSVVYQADLEMALRYSLFHEIPQFGEIINERLLALQRFVSVLNR